MDPERTLNPLPDLGIMCFISTVLKVWTGDLWGIPETLSGYPQGQIYLNKNANVLFAFLMLIL